MDKTGEHTIRPAEIAADGCESGAEQASELDGAVRERPVHDHAAEQDTEHDREHVCRVFTESRKAHDGEDTADGGAVEVAADGEDERQTDQTIDAGIDQRGCGTEHAQVIAGSASAGAQQTAIGGEHSRRTLTAQQQAGQDEHGAQDDKQNGEGQGAAGCPAVLGGRGGTERADERHDQKGDQTAGKADIIKVHAVLYFISIGRQGGQDKADNHTGEDAGRQGTPAVVEYKVADDRRQRGCHQTGGCILGKGLVTALGVQPCAEQDGPDVEEVFSEQRKTGHQTDDNHRDTVVGYAGKMQNEDTDGRDQRGVDQRGAGACNEHIVGDERGFGQNDLGQTGGQLRERAEQQTGNQKQGGVAPEEERHPLIACMCV